MATFDLWMNRGQHDTFVLVINLLFTYWKQHHVTIALFNVNDIIKHGIGKELKALLEKFFLASKFLCYVKDEGTMVLKFVISCEALSL
jgi:hypothetical protein